MPQRLSPLPDRLVPVRRRRSSAVPLRWAPAAADAIVQRILDNSLSSACALVGAAGGFVVAVREWQRLDIVSTLRLSRRAVLDAVLGVAAPVIHGALLERCLTASGAEAGTSDVVAVPLGLGHSGHGAFCLLRQDPRRVLGALDFEILEALAAQATLALATAQQQDALQVLQAHLGDAH